MKIALVILHADPTRGGAERYTHGLAEALARSHDVSLLASTFSSQKPTGVDAVVIPANGMTRVRRYRHFIDSLDTHLAAKKYDIVHAMLPVRRCDLYHPHAGLATTIDHAKGLKWLTNAMNRRRGAFAKVERELLHGEAAPIVLCLSQRMRENVIAEGVSPPERTVVLFNAVDLARFDPARFPHHQSDRLRALMVAQDFDRKGLRPAIEAIAQSPRWHLTVVGKDHAAPYQRLADSLGVTDRVTFAGQLDDVRPMYQQADVFILPTKHDPCSLVVLEALAMGIPVISTRANGACEIMSDGLHGFVLESPEDVGAITQSLAALSDQQRRMDMRSACVELRQRLSFDTHVGALEQIMLARSNRLVD